jgi:hypothetical protein
MIKITRKMLKAEFKTARGGLPTLAVIVFEKILGIKRGKGNGIERKVIGKLISEEDFNSIKKEVERYELKFKERQAKKKRNNP